MEAEKTRFHTKVQIDFMFMEGSSQLHIVDDIEHLSTAQIVYHLKTESIWDTTPTLWATVYSIFTKYINV